VCLQSYALLQERGGKAHASAAAPAAASSGAGTGGSGLARAGTTRRPAAPLMTVQAPYQQPNAPQGPPATYGFEPGTLLGGGRR
jgi:hypothetical protein